MDSVGTEKILSFIVPAYNAERTLSKCLGSFLCDDDAPRKKMEVIIIDDGSRDKTLKIAMEYTEKYPGLFTVYSQENGGHGEALNSGITRANGKYIKCVDSDDWVITNHLPKLINILSKCEADVVILPYYTIDQQTGQRVAYPIRLPEVSDFQKSYSIDEIVHDFRIYVRCLSYHGVAFRREHCLKVGHRLPRKVFYEDMEYVTVNCALAKSFYPVNLYLYAYRIGDVSQSVSAKSRVKRLGDSESVTENLLNFYTNLKKGEAKDKKNHTSRQNRESLQPKAVFCQLMIEQVILSHYVTTCLLEKDKRKGNRDFTAYNRMLKMKAPDLYRRLTWKRVAYQLMNKLHFSESMYRRLLDSRLYKSIRKK